MRKLDNQITFCVGILWGSYTGIYIPRVCSICTARKGPVITLLRKKSEKNHSSVTNSAGVMAIYQKKIVFKNPLSTLQAVMSPLSLLNTGFHFKSITPSCSGQRLAGVVCLLELAPHRLWFRGWVGAILIGLLVLQLPSVSSAGADEGWGWNTLPGRGCGSLWSVGSGGSGLQVPGDQSSLWGPNCLVRELCSATLR